MWLAVKFIVVLSKRLGRHTATGPERGRSGRERDSTRHKVISVTRPLFSSRGTLSNAAKGDKISPRATGDAAKVGALWTAYIERAQSIMVKVRVPTNKITPDKVAALSGAQLAGVRPIGALLPREHFTAPPQAGGDNNNFMNSPSSAFHSTPRSSVWSEP